MSDKISKSAIASFLFGNGVAGVLAYFGNTLPALILSIASLIVGAGLGIWWLISSKNKVKSEITTESIRQDLNRYLLRKLWFRFSGFVILMAVISLGMFIFIHVQSTRPRLTMDTIINSVTMDTNSQVVNVSWDIIINNNEIKPAFQNLVKFAAAPLNHPEDVVFMPDALQPNPINKGTKNQVPMEMSFNHDKQSNKAVIITRTIIQYSDGQNGIFIHHYTNTWWWALTISFSPEGLPQKADMVAVQPSLIPIYEKQMDEKD